MDTIVALQELQMKQDAQKSSLKVAESVSKSMVVKNMISMLQDLGLNADKLGVTTLDEALDLIDKVTERAAF